MREYLKLSHAMYITKWKNAFGEINVPFIFMRPQIFSMDVKSIKIITLCTRWK